MGAAGQGDVVEAGRRGVPEGDFEAGQLDPLDLAGERAADPLLGPFAVDRRKEACLLYTSDAADE